MAELIIDCQILQTAAYDRGMGKYTLSLLQALLHENKRLKRYKAITLLLNKNLTTTKQRLSFLDSALPGTSKILLNLPIEIAQQTQKKTQTAQKKITEYITTNHDKKDIDFLITAPFFVGFASVFPAIDSVKKLSIVYDLTPQKIWHLQKIFPDDLYFGHYQLLLEADHLFTISQAVKQDLIALGLPKKKITSIDGGPFMATAVSTANQSSFKKPYVLMPTAPIIHKNNERAVKAFASFNKHNKKKFHLYITSSFDENTQAALKKISPNVDFTGNISDEELALAYGSASTVLFPSLAEGLGMPVLEGVVHETPVACSKIPVLEEISGAAFYFFDPTNVDDIERALREAVDKTDWTQRKRAYKKVREQYTWAASAVKLLNTPINARKPAQAKPALVIDAPDPQGDTPAGYMAEQCYAQLRESYDVTYRFGRSKGSKRPSYIMHLGIAHPANSRVESLVVRDVHPVKRLLNRKKQLEVVVKDSRGAKVIKSRIDAHRVPLDPALNISGWDFYVSNKKVTSGTYLASLVKRGGK